MNNQWLILARQRRKQKWNDAVTAVSSLKADDMRYLAGRIMQYVYDLKFQPRLLQEDMIEEEEE